MPPCKAERDLMKTYNNIEFSSSGLHVPGSFKEGRVILDQIYKTRICQEQNPTCTGENCPFISGSIDVEDESGVVYPEAAS